MTIDEAKAFLQSRIDLIDKYYPQVEDYREALDMAIKALEQTELNPSYNSIKTELKPCGDCISREAIKEMLTETWTKYMPMELDMNLSFVLEKISVLPSVIPKAKTGHWIDIMVEDMPAQVCDQCKTFYPLSYTGGGHNYCPSCGSRMVEPQESEDKE